VYTQNSTVNSYVYRNGALEEYFTGTGVSPISGTRVQVGGRTGGSVPTRVFTGDIAECLIYDRALTATEIAQVSKWLNDKWGTGITRPAAGHPEAQDWLNRVYYNGGTVSQYTADLVSDFCYRIDAAGLRSKFYRLNLFCGNNLQAALVPLYRGPRPLDQIYGGAIDRTVNYFSGATPVGNGFYNNSHDYLEGGSVTTGGLTGASASNTRVIYTGLYYKELPSLLNAHFSSFFRVNTTPSAAAYPLGGLIGGPETTVNFQQVRINVAAPTTSGFSFATAISGTNLASGDNVALGPHFIIASRTSTTSLTAYLDGATAGTNTTATPDYQSPYTLAICGASNGSSHGGAFPHTICGYSAGLGLSQAEAQAYNRIMQYFQLHLGRGELSVAYAAAHPEAQNWYQRAMFASGTISATTLTAVSNFCTAIDAAGLRNKIYRLNLFCGGNLAACLTPLYCGPTPGAVVGRAADLNQNYGGSLFAAGNYTESTGLRGTNLTNLGPYLDTGLTPKDINTSNSLHGMTVVLEESTQQGAYFGATSISGSNFEAVSRAGYINTSFSVSATAPTGVAPEMLTFVRSTVNNIVAYRNAAAGTPNTTTIGTTPSDGVLAIFARLIYGGNGVTLFHNGRLGGYSFGTALTASDVNAYYSAMQTLQAALGRTI
jgi:hypothetical protein